MSRQPTLLLAHTVSPERTESLKPKLEASLPPGVVISAATPSETEAKLPETDVLVTGMFDDGWLEHLREPQLIQTLWAGIDSFPLDRIQDRDIALANASGVHAEPIAQQVLGYLLQFERGLVETVRNQQRGVWESVQGGELGNKTLGVVGAGAIGTRVGELAQPFGMEVIGTKRDLSERPAGFDSLLPADEYRTLLQRAEYVVLACPLTEETEGLLGLDEFRLMDRDSVLVNVARGEIVEHDALVTALQYKLIRGAALDVFTEEPLVQESVLWDLSNVILTPHMAWTSPRTTDRWLDIIEQNYLAIAGDDAGSLVNRVV